MTTAGATALGPRPLRPRAGAVLAVGRMFRLELLHSAMLWLLPLAAGLFWYDAYRPSMAVPPLWSLRALTMQHGALLTFVLPVVGAASWMGSRDSRRGMGDLAGIAARPRWVRQLVSWAAVTGWALAGYAVCVGALYAATARQAAWGGPLWWPAVVGAAGIPLLAAIGFAAGSCFPGRFTTPLVSVAAFFGLGFSSELARGGTSYWQISPIIAGAVDVGPDPGVATFYPYLPDLPIAQLMFLAGLAVAVLGALGWPAGSGSRWLRGTAVLVTIAGLISSATAVGLVGTARLDPHGMMNIPALHDAANEQPIRYSPVCSQAAIAVCLNPAFAAYLPVVTSALQPVVSEVSGLASTPTRILQAAPTFTQEPNDAIRIGAPGLPGTGAIAGARPRVLIVALPDQLPGERQPDLTTAEFADQVRAQVGVSLADYVIGSDRRHSQAQQAVRAGMLIAAGVRLVAPGQRMDERGVTARGPAPGTAVYRAAQRFAALPGAARLAWLRAHLRGLRAGRITLGELP
jgi:hypothetical protein